MNSKYAVVLSLIATLNLSSCSARKPEQTTEVRQTSNSANQQQTNAPYGTVVDFEQLVTQHGSESAALEVLLKTNMVVCDFYAQWCPPCKQLAPNFIEAAKLLPTVLFVKIDAEKYRDISKMYHIRSFPTLIFLRDGVKLNAFSGFRSQKALIDETSSIFNL